MAYLTYDDFEVENGYIYVIKVLGYCKIGKTKNPEKRFGEYTMLMKEPEVLLLDYVTDYHRLELDLHEAYEHKRIRGEWFKLSENDIENIKFLLDGRHVKTDMDRFYELQNFLKTKYNNLVQISISEHGEYLAYYLVGKNFKTKIPIRVDEYNIYKLQKDIMMFLSYEEEMFALNIDKLTVEQLASEETISKQSS